MSPRTKNADAPPFRWRQMSSPKLPPPKSCTWPGPHPWTQGPPPLSKGPPPPVRLHSSRGSRQSLRPSFRPAPMPTVAFPGLPPPTLGAASVVGGRALPPQHASGSPAAAREIGERRPQRGLGRIAPLPRVVASPQPVLFRGIVAVVVPERCRHDARSSRRRGPRPASRWADRRSWRRRPPPRTRPSRTRSPGARCRSCR